jgi:hypothetical protein
VQSEIDELEVPAGAAADATHLRRMLADAATTVGMAVGVQEIARALVGEAAPGLTRLSGDGLRSFAFLRSGGRQAWFEPADMLRSLPAFGRALRHESLRPELQNRLGDDRAEFGPAEANAVLEETRAADLAALGTALQRPPLWFVTRPPAATNASPNPVSSSAQAAQSVARHVLGALRSRSLSTRDNTVQLPRDPAHVNSLQNNVHLLLMSTVVTAGQELRTSPNANDRRLLGRLTAIAGRRATPDDAADLLDPMHPGLLAMQSSIELTDAMGSRPAVTESMDELDRFESDMQGVLNTASAAFIINDLVTAARAGNDELRSPGTASRSRVVDLVRRHSGVELTAADIIDHFDQVQALVGATFLGIAFGAQARPRHHEGEFEIAAAIGSMKVEAAQTLGNELAAGGLSAA